jgi:hypothetical protein
MITAFAQWYRVMIDCCRQRVVVVVHAMRFLMADVAYVAITLKHVGWPHMAVEKAAVCSAPAAITAIQPALNSLAITLASIATGPAKKPSVLDDCAAFALTCPTPQLLACIAAAPSVEMVALFSAHLAWRARLVVWMPTVFSWLSP